MTQAMTKEETQGNQVGATICVNPTLGETQVISYITGEMTEDEYHYFVAHVSECDYCFKQIVIWRMAEALAEAEVKPAQAARAV